MSKKKNKKNRIKKTTEIIEVNNENKVQDIQAGIVDATIDEAAVVEVIEANTTNTTMAEVEVEKIEPIALGPSQPQVEESKPEPKEEPKEVHEEPKTEEPEELVIEVQVEVEQKETEPQPEPQKNDEPKEEPKSSSVTANDPDDSIVWRMEDGSYVIKSSLPKDERTGTHVEWICESPEKAAETRQKLEDAAKNFDRIFNEIHGKRLEREEKIQKRVDTVTTPVRKIKELFKKKSA